MQDKQCYKYGWLNFFMWPTMVAFLFLSIYLRRFDVLSQIWYNPIIYFFSICFQLVVCIVYLVINRKSKVCVKLAIAGILSVVIFVVSVIILLQHIYMRGGFG